MSAWGHRFVPLDERGKLSSCNSCRGPYGTKPRADIGFRYAYYIKGRAGRVSWAERRLCAKHATSAAKKYGLMKELAALRAREAVEHES